MKIRVLLFLALAIVMVFSAPVSAQNFGAVVCFTPGNAVPFCLTLPVDGFPYVIPHPTGPLLGVILTDIGPIQCNGGGCGPNPCNNGVAHRWRIQTNPVAVPAGSNYRVSVRVPGIICNCVILNAGVVQVLQGCGTTLWIGETGGPLANTFFISYGIDFLTPNGYGPGCPDAIPPDLDILNSGFPQIGTSFGVVLTNASPGVPASLLMSATSTYLPLTPFTSATSYVPPKPLVIDGPTCVLNVGPGFVGFPAAVTSPTGTASTYFPIPNAPALAGLSVYFQWLVLDPGAPGGVPPLAFAMTPGLSVVIVD